MGGKSSQSTSQVTIPPEVLARYNSVNAQAQTAAEKPFQQYSTDPNAFVAPVNAQESTGISGVNAAANQAQPYFGAATNTLMGAYGNTQPLNAMAEYGTAASSSPLTGQQINQYLSPYLGTVLGSQEQLLNQQNQQAMAGQLGNAISSGAFGGDRAGIAAANLNQQQNLANANIYSNILNQGYNQALQTAQGQQQIGLAGANQLANIGNLAFQQGAGTSQALAGLGTGAQGAALQGAQAQIGAGQLQQQTTQAGDTALYNQFLQQQSYPFQVANFLAGIAEGTGALSGSTTTGTQPGGFFSDERLKEDIKEVGKTHDGQPIYSYKMKGDPRTQMGLIAQEVEERHPEAVGVAGGYKTVDYGKALKDASMGGHVGLAHAGEEYARGGYAGGGYSTTLTANPGGLSDASMVNPNDLAAIIQAQQQMYVGAGGPTAYGGLAGGPPHGGVQGYVPTTSMPAAHLQTASLPKQGPSAAEQVKQVNEAANSMESLYNTGKAGLVGTAEDKNHNATAGLLGSGGDWSTVKSKLFGPSNAHVAADATGTTPGVMSKDESDQVIRDAFAKQVPAANEEPEPAQDDIQPEQDNAPHYRGGVAGHMHYAGGGLAGRGMYADGGSDEDPYANEDPDPYTEKPKGLDIEASKNDNKLATSSLSPQGQSGLSQLSSGLGAAGAIAGLGSKAAGLLGSSAASLAPTIGSGMEGLGFGAVDMSGLADMLPVLALASGGVAGGRHGYAVDGTVQDDDQPTGVFKDSSDSFAPTTDGAGGDGVSPMNADPKDPNNVWERVKNNWKAHFSGHPENIINPDTSSGVSPPAFSPSTQSQRENDLYKKVSSEKPLTPAPAAGLIALPEKNVPEPSYAADLQRPDVGLESGFAKQAASQIPLKDVNQNQGLAGGEPSAAPSVDAKEMSDRLSTGTAHEPSFIQRLIKDGTLSRQTVIPFLTGLAAMGTAPTRSLGVALSAGVGAGAQSYANQQEDIARLAQTQATTSQIKASTGTQMYNVAAAKAPPGTRPVAGPPSDPNQATFTTPDGQQWHYEPIYKFTNWGGTGGAGTPVGSTPTAAMKRNDDGSLYMGPSSATDNVLRQRYGFDPSLPPIANIYKASGMGHPEVMVDPTQLRAHQESIGKTGYEADDAGRTYVQLAKSLNGLSDGTFTGAGPGFEDRQNLANIYGYMTKLFGVKNDLNQNDIDQGQIIAKINKLQASALAHQNGERAASIAMGLQSSLPGGAQTKEAANTNLSAMMIQNQRARDFRDYTNSYISRYGTDAGLEESFNRDMGDVYAKEKEAIPKLFKKTQTGKSLAEELLTNPSSERRLKLERGIKQADGSYKNGIGEGSTRYLL